MNHNYLHWRISTWSVNFREVRFREGVKWSAFLSTNTSLLRFTYRYIVVDFHTLRARKVRRRCKKNKKGLVLFLSTTLNPSKPLTKYSHSLVRFVMAIVYNEKINFTSLILQIETSHEVDNQPTETFTSSLLQYNILLNSHDTFFGSELIRIDYSSTIAD